MRKIIFSFVTIAALLLGSATASAMNLAYPLPSTNGTGDGSAGQQPNYMNNQVGGSSSIGLSSPPAPSGPTYQASVIIHGMQFIPTYLTVYTGTMVTWNNEDTVAHTVTSDSIVGNVQFDSGTLQPGQRFSFFFSRPGIYAYHCNIHSFMHGTVNIINKPQPSQPSSPPTSTTPQPPAASPSPSASAQANATAANNYYAAQKAPPAAAAVTQPLPSTGPAGTITAATITALLGTGGYYIYLFRRKKFS